MIDLSKYEKVDVKNRIVGIGVELEGGWRHLPRGMHDVVRDGSLDVWRPPSDTAYKGEIPSPILKVGAELTDWLTSHYPSYCDHMRCAMHVHMSVSDNFRYQQVMTPDYMLTVAHYLKQWAAKEGFAPGHHIWGRLSGQSEYCRLDFLADRQVTMRTKLFDRDIPGNRYTGINYPWARFKTFECRLLPMMKDAAQAERAVLELVSITNKFLLATAKKEKKQAASVEMDLSPEVRESITII